MLKIITTSDIKSLEKEIAEKLEKVGPATSSSEVLLASNSPRRKKLLSPIFPKMNVLRLDKHFEQNVLCSTIELIPIFHSLEKALFAIKQLTNPVPKLIITADTVVFYDSPAKILEKPENRSEAKEMLYFHMGKTQKVATAAVCLNFTNKNAYKIIDIAEVTFKQKTAQNEKIIEEYLKLFPPDGPMDKAGAYGIQETLIANNLIESITGDINTVIGFPVEKFLQVYNKTEA